MNIRISLLHERIHSACPPSANGQRLFSSYPVGARGSESRHETHATLNSSLEKRTCLHGLLPTCAYITFLCRHYFDGRGRAEPIRWMLEETGTAYTENVIRTQHDMQSLRASGKLLYNQVTFFAYITHLHANICVYIPIYKKKITTHVHIYPVICSTHVHIRVCIYANICTYKYSRVDMYVCI